MVNEIKEENTTIVSKTVICGDTYFCCKIDGVAVWFYHKDDMPMKYKELVENLK